MSEEVLIAVLALFHAGLLTLAGVQAYKCAVGSQCVRTDEDSTLP